MSDWTRRAPSPTWLLVLASGAGGALAGASPTGLWISDVVLSFGAAAVVALGGTRARRWSMFPFAAVGVAFGAPPVGLVAGLVALGVATRAQMRRRADPFLGTLVGAVGVQALFRLDIPGFHGADTLVAFAAAAPLLLSGYRNRRPKEQRVARRVAVTVGLASGGVLMLGLLSVLMARPAADRGVSQIQQGLRSARAGDSEAAAAVLERAGDSFEDANGALTAWWARPARLLPIVGFNVRSMEEATAVAADVAAVGSAALEEASSDELEVRGGTIPIDAFAALEEPLSSVEASLDAAMQRIEQTPSAWEVDPVGRRIENLHGRLVEAQRDTDVALQGVRSLPEFFGSAGPRRYLVLFVTPVEARGTGFPGNFAELTFTDGKVEMTRFGRVLELERARPEVVEVSMPAEFEARYGRFGATRSWRNITMSPDFLSAAEVARQLYPQSGGLEVDGVLSVDPAGLADLLRLTGPVSVPGIRRELTAQNAERFLLEDQYLELPDTPDRADALESLGRATFDALLERDLPRPQTIARVLSPAFDRGHMRVVAFDPDEAAFFDEADLDGALPPVRSDALAITTNNVTGNKIDLFLQRTIDYDVDWDPTDGTVESTLRVHLVNSSPSSGLPDYVIGNAINQGSDIPLGTNRTYLSIFTPLDLESATIDGVPVAMEAQTEAGRRVYSAFLELGPNGGEATLELTFTGSLPGAYLLDLFPQVLPNPDIVSVRLTEGGRNRQEMDAHELIRPETIGE